MFAENVRIRAMLLRTGVTDMGDPKDLRAGVIRLYDEGLRLSDHFTAFANAVMVEIAKRLNAKVEKISSSAVTDFTKLMPSCLSMRRVSAESKTARSLNASRKPGS